MSGPGVLLPDSLLSRDEVLAQPCPIRKAPGVYAWYFRQIPPGVPTDGCTECQGRTLLYIGISPSAPAANDLAYPGRPLGRI